MAPGGALFIEGPGSSVGRFQP